MEQGVTAVIMMMLIVFVFIPAVFLGTLSANRQKINEAMYLATRALEDCVLETDYTLDEIAQGYGYSEDPIMRIRIDEGKLFTEFDDVLFKNISNLKQFAKVEENIRCKILVYPDRYVVWENINPVGYKEGSGELYYNYDEEYEEYVSLEKDMNVSAPKYFTYKRVNKSGTDQAQQLFKYDAGGALLDSGYFYINTVNDKIRKFGNTESWRNIDSLITDYRSKFNYNMLTDEQNAELTTAVPITTYDKNQVIIETLNKEIAYYTDGVEMEFINPAGTRMQNIKSTKKDFNFFNGITFLVVYREDNYLHIGGESTNFHQYTVAGYTLEN